MRLRNELLLEIAKVAFRPMDTLYIDTPCMGPGLFIQHGFSTIIAARSIGEDCWINQQVTIGYSDVYDCPIIGNNVKITAGAKVFGDISIGDNCIVVQMPSLTRMYLRTARWLACLRIS